MKQRHAFTVIELLVVIAIFGLLLVMLAPSSCGHRSGEKARRTQCLNNLKQIGLACAQYATDYGDRLPCGRDSVFANAALMSKYLSTTKLLVCPSSSKMSATNYNDAIATDTANVSYTQQPVPHTGRVLVNGTLVSPWNAATEVLFWDQNVAGNPCGPTGDSGLSWAVTGNHKTAGGNVLFNGGYASFHTKTPTNMPLGCLNP